MQKNRKPSVKRAVARTIIASTTLGINTLLTFVSRKPKVISNNAIMNVVYDKHIKYNSLNIFLPPSSASPKQKTIFFIHGGAFCSGDKKFYNSYCSKLAQNGFIVVNINYRLIPLVQIDTIYEDCTNAINFCLKHYGFMDKENIVLCGDSAGATICAMLAARHQSKKILGDAVVKGLVLYYGVYDYLLTEGIFKILLDNVMIYQYPEEDINKLSKKHSPIHHIKKGFPPCFITSGSADKLHVQSLALIKKLKRLKTKHVSLLFENRKDGNHGFLNFAKKKTNKESFDAALEFLKNLYI